MQGRVKVKKHIARVKSNEVVFVDGTTVASVDAIVLCTGYDPDYPFMSADVVPRDKSQMYLTVFPRNRKFPTLAVQGCFRMKGLIIVAIEMQARYIAKVIKVNIYTCN